MIYARSFPGPAVAEVSSTSEVLIVPLTQRDVAADRQKMVNLLAVGDFLVTFARCSGCMTSCVPIREDVPLPRGAFGKKSGQWLALIEGRSGQITDEMP
jgi:hypothetical protein